MESEKFKRQLKEASRELEELIASYLPPEEGLQKTVLEAMNYSVLAGGKRLRPLLRHFGNILHTMHHYLRSRFHGKDGIYAAWAVELHQTGAGMESCFRSHAGGSDKSRGSGEDTYPPRAILETGICTPRQQLQQPLIRHAQIALPRISLRQRHT